MPAQQCRPLQGCTRHYIKTLIVWWNGTAYADLAIALHTAHGTDGYQTAWFSQRLSATCAKHGQPLNGST
jgi:hypothetical protein